MLIGEDISRSVFIGAQCKAELACVKNEDAYEASLFMHFTDERRRTSAVIPPIPRAIRNEMKEGKGTLK